MTRSNRLKSALLSLGLLGALRKGRRNVRKGWRSLTRADVRARRRRDLEHFLEFKTRYGESFRRRTPGSAGANKALLVARYFPAIEINVSLVKALELAGFDVAVLLISERGALKEYYRLAGIREIVSWRSAVEKFDFSTAASSIVQQCASVEALRNVEHLDLHVGRSAVSTVLRSLRIGTLDLKSANIRMALTQQLASAMASAEAASRILDDLRPALMLSTDIEYTTGAELFESCLARGIPVIKYGRPHRANALMLKRYGPENRDQHPSSLSENSWSFMKRLEWSDSFRQELQKELYEGYAAGYWYGISAEVDKHSMPADLVRQRLGLDPHKKTAFVFSHVAWDAVFRWGQDLFRGYEEWFVETVRVAAANDRVNWVIKIHPLHIRKNASEGRHDEPAELTALRKSIGSLPPHVFLLPAETDISTFALFPLMDYCVTVRGTVGIEAAMRGIPTLTAGTGRYDHRGFTVDSESREQYLDRLRRIETIPPLSPTQRELAERFAYAIFLLRPFRMSTVQLEFRDDHPGDIRYARSRLNVTTPRDWVEAPDLRDLAGWIRDSPNPDFLVRAPDNE